MDSDEDFMSAVSSEDDILPDDSENEDMSGGEGQYFFLLSPPRCRHDHLLTYSRL